jgi:hypothetical protein
LDDPPGAAVETETSHLGDLPAVGDRVGVSLLAD